MLRLRTLAPPPCGHGPPPLATFRSRPLLPPSLPAPTLHSAFDPAASDNADACTWCTGGGRPHVIVRRLSRSGVAQAARSVRELLRF